MSFNVRVELLVPITGASSEFPAFFRISGVGHDVRRSTDGIYLSVVALDTPSLRAKIIEMITAHPGTCISVCACVCDDRAQRDVRSTVEQAFAEAASPVMSYNMKDAARKLGISYSYIKELVQEGRIRRINGRIAAYELARFLQKPS